MMPMFFSKPDESKWIKARCVIPDIMTVGDDTWPTEFRMEPRMGEFVESSDGRRLKIIQVTYRKGEDGPLIELELGADRSSVTPSEGGGGAEGIALG